MNNNINESSLSRIYRHNILYDCGTITAYRKAADCGNGRLYTTAEKLARNHNLKLKLMSKGYGVSPIKGKYLEGGTDLVKEESFFVFDNKNLGTLLDDLCTLGLYFEQDSILFIPKGTVDNLNRAFLIGTNYCSNNELKINDRMYFNNSIFGKEGTFYTSFVNGRPFILENMIIEDPVVPPGNGTGWWSLHTKANQDWDETIENNIYSKSISFKNSNAYWLNTNGQIYDVPITHIQAVIADPDRYNLTLEYIKSIYNKFNEPMNFEGHARKEIMIKMIKEFNWIRLRKIIRNGLWQGNVKSFEPLYMNTLKKWLSVMVDKKYTYGTDEILLSCEFERVSDFKKIVNENNTTNIQVTINEFLKTDF